MPHPLGIVGVVIWWSGKSIWAQLGELWDKGNTLMFVLTAFAATALIGWWLE
jgi:hypothetical protein